MLIKFCIICNKKRYLPSNIQSLISLKLNPDFKVVFHKL